MSECKYTVRYILGYLEFKKAPGNQRQIDFLIHEFKVEIFRSNMFTKYPNNFGWKEYIL